MAASYLVLGHPEPAGDEVEDVGQESAAAAPIVVAAAAATARPGFLLFDVGDDDVVRILRIIDNRFRRVGRGRRRNVQLRRGEDRGDGGRQRQQDQRLVLQNQIGVLFLFEALF